MPNDPFFDIKTWESVEILDVDEQGKATLLNTRTYTQYIRYIDDLRKGVSPFCDLDETFNEVIREASYQGGMGGNESRTWRMWHNPFPQKHCRVHLVLAPTQYVTNPEELIDADWKCINDLFAWAISEKGVGIKGGGLLMRFGDPTLNAGSIRHIHANIIGPDGTGEVRLPLAKDPEKVESKKKVAVAWEKMRRYHLRYTGPDLTLEDLARAALRDPDELALVIDRLE